MLRSFITRPLWGVANLPANVAASFHEAELLPLALQDRIHPQDQLLCLAERGSYVRLIASNFFDTPAQTNQSGMLATVTRRSYDPARLVQPL